MSSIVVGASLSLRISDGYSNTINCVSETLPLYYPLIVGGKIVIST